MSCVDCRFCLVAARVFGYLLAARMFCVCASRSYFLNLADVRSAQIASFHQSEWFCRCSQDVLRLRLQTIFPQICRSTQTQTHIANATQTHRERTASAPHKYLIRTSNARQAHRQRVTNATQTQRKRTANAKQMHRKSSANAPPTHPRRTSIAPQTLCKRTANVSTRIANAPQTHFKRI